MGPTPIHLHPTAALAPRALLPGDPGRALALAQQLLDKPLMFNHSRGLWGYSGTAHDGEALTIQATGLGGPSAAIVLEELCDLGLERAVRVGTCTALSADLRLGDVIAADEVLGCDGASGRLGAPEILTPDATLTQRLVGEAEHTGRVVSSDLFYDPDASRARAWAAAGALAVEMQCAALLAVGARRGLAVGCLLTVSAGPDGRLEGDGLTQAESRLGLAGLTGLGDALPAGAVAAR